jgi:two-component system, NarL family, sensor kinase
VSSVRREVLRFAVPGIVALLVVAAGSLWLARSVSTDEAIDDARSDARVLARGTIEPAVTQDLVAGNPDALAYLDAVVRERVLSRDVVSVRLWTADGTVVYADDPDLIGRQYDLGPDELEILDHGGAEAELSDLSKPENAGQRAFGELLEVYLRVRTPEGQPLLFEVYQRQSTIDSRARDVLGTLAPLVIVPLVVLMAVELTLAWRMARRLEQSTGEREQLLRRAVDSSEAERRRIAADLHDGVVQDMAGVTYTLAALADTAAAAGEDEQASRLTAAAGETRRSVRSLRSLLVEIYPPNLADAGLEAAVSDLASATIRGAAAVTVRVDPALRLPDEVEAVVYRVAREALQNVAKHAQADVVVVSFEPDGDAAVLTVRDDGRGFDPADVPVGHVGLRLLADLAAEHGTDLTVESRPGEGTTVRLVVPP